MIAIYSISFLVNVDLVTERDMLAKAFQTHNCPNPKSTYLFFLETACPTILDKLS